MIIDDLTRQSGEWMRGTGPEADIVISSRIRLARNLDGFPFLSRCDGTIQGQIEEMMHEVFAGIKRKMKLTYFSIENTGAIDRQFLVERHLISKELAEGDGPRGVAIAPDEVLAIMINEEDHLRMQVLGSGFCGRELWEIMNGYDDYLEKKITYSFSPSLGYLTACPTNVGTGLRVSVMLHLPALVVTKQIEKIFQAVAKINLAVRGLYGEGTEASGDFFQVSNQITLGRSEEDIVSNLEAIIPQIIRYEREARKVLVNKNLKLLEDKIWRAYGILRSARSISSDETMHLLSAVRLGINLDLLDDVDLRTINELFIQTQPAHLQKLEECELEPEERDIARADFVRHKLGQQ